MIRAMRRRLRRLLQPERTALADLRAIFDAAWYVREYPDLATFRGDLFGHFLRHGIGENRRPNRFFDPVWYERHHSSEAGRPPLVHYAVKGRAARLDPGPNFSVTAYHDRHRDVARAGIDALEHYLKFGRHEGRQIFRSKQAGGHWSEAADDLSSLIDLADLPLGIEETTLRLATRLHLRGALTPHER